MNKSNFNKKMIISVAGAALLSIGFAGLNGQDGAINATTVSAKTAKSKVVGVNSAVYKKIGKKIVKTSAVIKAGNKVTINGKKTIKGVTYYEVGKGQYIKAANVNGKNHKLAKSTSLYTRSGKAIKGSKMAKGKMVRTFGKAITINGKKFYATKHGYVPAKALAVKQAPVDDITPTNPATPTAPTTPTDNTNTQKPSNTTSNTTNVINGSGSSSNSNTNNVVQSVKWQGQDLKLDNGVLTIPGSETAINDPVTILSALNADKVDPDSVKAIRIDGKLTLTGKADKLFSGLHNLTQIIGLDKVDTSGVTSMQSMFSGCQSLTTFDLSKFDTTKVTDMSQMFNSCDSLAEIKFGENFKTTSVTNMNQMFAGDKQLKSLDLSKFDTTKVTDMSQMFNSCDSLAEIKFGENFKTTSVTNMNQMFAGDKQLKSLDLSKFVTTSVTDMSQMFAGDKFDELNLGGFSVSDSAKVTDAFKDASVAKLTVLTKNAKNLLKNGGLDLSKLGINLENDSSDTATTYPKQSPSQPSSEN